MVYSAMDIDKVVFFISYLNDYNKEINVTTRKILHILDEMVRLHFISYEVSKKVHIHHFTFIVIYFKIKKPLNNLKICIIKKRITSLRCKFN